jgi:hypothetical protein
MSQAVERKEWELKGHGIGGPPSQSMYFNQIDCFLPSLPLSSLLFFVFSLILGFELRACAC